MANEQLEKDWTEISSKLSRIKGTAKEPPRGIVTQKFTTGMLLGNGDIGVVVGDTVTTQKFYFGKSDFWGKIYRPGNDTWQQGIISLGGLTIRSPENGTEAESVYRMEQDILHAEVNTTMQFGQTTVSMRSWTADTDNVFVTELSSPSDSQDVSIDIELWLPSSYESKGGVLDLMDVHPYASGSSNGILWVTRENNTELAMDYKARAAIVLQLIGASFERTDVGSGNAQGRFVLSAGSTVQVAVVFRSGRGCGSDCPAQADVRDEAIQAAARLKAADMISLKRHHGDWWKEFWLKSYVNLHDLDLEKYYYGSLYVIGCCYRANNLLPPSLWGNWVTTDYAGWGGRYFLNYNEEAPLYGVFSANRPELAAPYNNVIFNELPYQINRTHNAGYRGAAYQRSLTPFNMFRNAPEIVPVAPTKDHKKLPADQKSNGGFAAMPAMWFYEYTQDTQFLREKLYPHLKELVLFYVDFVTKVELEGGGYRYDVCHSSAHEGTGNDTNPCLDIGFINKMTKLLIESSSVLGIAPDPSWQDLLDHLAPLPTGVYDGMECFLAAERVDPEQQHNQVIEPGDQPVELEGPVYPGENVALGGNEHDIQAARNTLAYMNSWSHTRWNEWNSAHNGFCKVYPIAARVGWPAEDLIAKFKTAIAGMWRESNLTVFQGGGGIETTGSIETVNSMLLQSEFDVIKVFPVWPVKQDAGFKRLRAKGAFIVSSEYTNGIVQFITIISEKGRRVNLRTPWETGTPVVASIDSDGRGIQSIPYEIKEGVISFDTGAGKTYSITMLF